MNIEEPDELIDYLRHTNRIGSKETPRVQPLTGGVSNRTVLVEREAAAESAWVIKQALSKLRVEVDWYSDPKRVHREALGLRSLEQLLPPATVPRFLFEDHDHHLLAMEAVATPHENWKTRLLSGRLDINHVRHFAEILGQIHSRAIARADQLSKDFEDRSYFESLRLEPYYARSMEVVPEARTFLESLIDETRTQRKTLVHGDYSPKNVLVYNDRLVLLDHEVIHWGDPTFDVGFSMTHLLSKAHHLSAQRHDYAVAATTYWDDYVGSLGAVPWQNDLQSRAVRQTLGCLLARVAGRSPLEYLSQIERMRQQEVVLELMQHVPTTMSELIARFTERLESVADHRTT